MVEEVVNVLMECRMVHPTMFAGQIVREDVAVKSMGGGGGKVTSPCCGLAAWILEPRGRRCVVAEVGSQFALVCGVDRARGLSRHATRRRVSMDSGEMVHDDFGPQHLHDGPMFRVSVR